MQLNPMRHLTPIVFALACALAACSDQNPETASAAPPASPPASKSSSSSADDAVTVSGPLIVEHQLDVLAQREGVIESLRADVGSRVKSGAVLAQLDDRELTADVEAAHAKADGTEAEVKSWQSESKVLDADFDRAKKSALLRS